jgi:chemotaxis methyl-accepting protein methylase
MFEENRRLRELRDKLKAGIFERLDEVYLNGHPTERLPGNLNVSDPPFSRLDLVSCRNLLIYLDHTLQQRIISLFHYSLNPDGFLVLGPSETIGRSSELFRLIGGRHKIYRRQPAPARLCRSFCQFK